ncbi:MAG: transposase family protein [Bacteroidales bacterium]
MEIKDPRMVNKCSHKLSDILFIALSSLICNGEDFEDKVTVHDKK